MQAKPTLSIIIVTFNHEAEIIPCLEAIWASTGDWLTEIIVVDNASHDHTLEYATRFKQNNPHPRFVLKFIRSATNTGFTRGTNEGLQNARGEFLLLLNPDTRVMPDALEKLVNFLKNRSDVGIVAPQLLFPDGKIQPSCRRFPRRQDILWEISGLSRLFPASDRFNRWKMGNFSHKEIASVEQPQGAALMTHQTAVEKIGRLDDAFPMFFSDVDWCKRFFAAGFKVIFYPFAQIIHQKGSSIYRNRSRMLWSSHKSFIRYFRKYYTGVLNQILNFTIAFILLPLAGLRILTELIVRHFKHKFSN